MKSTIFITLITLIMFSCKQEKPIPQQTDYTIEIDTQGFATVYEDFYIILNKNNNFVIKQDDVELAITIDNYKRFEEKNNIITTLNYRYLLNKQKDIEYGEGSGKEVYEKVNDGTPTISKLIEHDLEIKHDNISLSWSTGGRDRFYLYLKKGQKYKVINKFNRYEFK